jgi:hypothetical protein
MRTHRHSWNLWAGALILGLFAVYAVWNARDLLGGAALAATGPEIVRGAEPVATLAGTVGRAATHLSVNGLPVLTDEKGYWENAYLLQPGRNSFVVESRDRFGNVETIERVVWYLPEEA